MLPSELAATPLASYPRTTLLGPQHLGPGVVWNNHLQTTSEPLRFRATGPDPWIEIPVAVPANRVRYALLRMSCMAARSEALGQIFWIGQDSDQFNERLALSFTVAADGTPRTYLLDLHRLPGHPLPNANWRYAGTIRRLRLDPMDCEGECIIHEFSLLPADFADDDVERAGCGLQPMREELSAAYLHGNGIEMGALQKPLPLPATSRVQYVDRLTLEEARESYPELANLPLVRPSIIADAEYLTAIPAGACDFCIGNHVLEHLRNPLGALRHWLRVLRPGGHMFVAIPDHMNPLDRHRDVTPLAHLLDDDEHRGARAAEDRRHYDEWASSVHADQSPEFQASYAADMIRREYAIHFHTFTADTFRSLLAEACRRFAAEVIEFHSVRGTDLTEHIAVLRKN